MSKLFLRFVALLLVACLTVDPALARGSFESCGSLTLTASVQDRLQEEALASILGCFTKPATGQQATVKFAQLRKREIARPDNRPIPYQIFDQAVRRLEENPSDWYPLEQAMERLENWIHDPNGRRRPGLPTMLNINHAALLDLMAKDLRLAVWADNTLKKLFCDYPDDFAVYARHVLRVASGFDRGEVPSQSLLNHIVVHSGVSLLPVLSGIFLFEKSDHAPPPQEAASESRRKTGIWILSWVIDLQRYRAAADVARFLEDLSHRDPQAYNAIVRNVYGVNEASRSAWFRSLVRRVEQRPADSWWVRAFLRRFRYPQPVQLEREDPTSLVSDKGKQLGESA